MAVAVNCTLVPAQIAPLGLAAIVTVGVTLEVTVIVNAELLLIHPVVLFLTVSVALYVPGAAAPGTTKTIGLDGNAALVTSTNPAVFAVAS